MDEGTISLAHIIYVLFAIVWSVFSVRDLINNPRPYAFTVIWCFCMAIVLFTLLIVFFNWASSVKVFTL